MIKKIIALFVAVLLPMGAVAGVLDNSPKPRLVINITIAGLRYDNLLKYAKAMNTSGIKRLASEGAYCNLSKINYLGATTSSGVASIATGTTPSSHGVLSSHWFDYTTNEKQVICFDKNIRTVGADELDAQVSPRSLVASTIGDCIKDISPSSKVISIATTPSVAVIAGGFMADDCYWVSPRDGKMVTSTFYRTSLPDWVTSFNSKELAKAYSEQRWMLSRSDDFYYNVLRSDVGESSSSKKYDYERLCTTPAASSLIKDFAVQTIIAENLGKDKSTDYLSIVFEAPKTTAQKYGENSVECEDVIYRLDDELATLISFVESYIGKGQLLVVLNSAHGISDVYAEDGRMPGGRFNGEQFEILINGFLGAQISSRLSDKQLAKIAKDDSPWVLDFVAGQMYLNRRKILTAGLKLSEVQDMVAQFAIQFRGVSSAITSTTLQGGQFSSGIMGMAHRSYFARHSGDVVLNLLPGWIYGEENLSDSGSPYIYDTHVPVIFWGGDIEPQEISSEVSLEDIAPTIAKIVGVTAPNSVTGKPIL